MTRTSLKKMPDPDLAVPYQDLFCDALKKGIVPALLLPWFHRTFILKSCRLSFQKLYLMTSII